jgi:hypothetical protein
MKVPWVFLVLILSSLVISSCAPSVYKEVYPTLLDGRYDSEFPYRGCSKQLEEISESVKRLTVMAHYKCYAFAVSDSVTLSVLTAKFLESQVAQMTFQDHATAGTATAIFSENGRIALLTCAHVVNFPDTVVSYYIGAQQKPSRFIKSYAIKTNQLNFLNEIPGGTDLEILALDRTSDIAIVGQKLQPHQTVGVRVFMYPFGRAKELEWGTFVYLFGYPSGYRMITKGIVSSPNRSGQGSFLVDAVVSPGSSGAIALAVRDGIPNFELVGIVKLIPAQSSFVLSPSKREGDDEYDPDEPYRGDVFVERKTEIQYGIAQAISAEAIADFIRKNQLQLEGKGYHLESLLRPPEAEKKKL